MWVCRDAAAARVLAAALAAALAAGALLAGARAGTRTDPSMKIRSTSPVAALVNAGVRASALRRDVDNAGFAAHWLSPAAKQLRLRGGATPSDAAPAEGGVHEGHAGRVGVEVPGVRRAEVPGVRREEVPGVRRVVAPGVLRRPGPTHRVL